MFQNRSVLFLGLALAIGLGTTILTYRWLEQQSPEPVQAEEVQRTGVPVAVASTAIAWGTPLTPDMIHVVDYPDTYVPEGAFQDPKALIGRIVLTPLNQYEPILESKLAPQDVRHGGVVGILSPDKRAMAVRVDEVVGLPGFVKPGDRVDIMVTLKNPRRRGGTITKTVLENTLVLATGTQMERQGPGEKPKPVKVITVEVSLKEAEKLALASNEGKLRLALRSPLNTKPELTKGATNRTLISSYRPKPTNPQTRRSRRERVEIIAGGRRTLVKF
ncbi:MAG: Flp pilus assembly protein CpaB [Nitrospirae bacterium]|nr:MAG: Flp pilus assembly protein CpaB [Nitrospirota bacterium]